MAGPVQFRLKQGQQVEIRERGSRTWKPYRMRKTIQMRTTKRLDQTIYGEYLNWEIRFRGERLEAERHFCRY